MRGLIDTLRDALGTPRRKPAEAGSTQALVRRQLEIALEEMEAAQRQTLCNPMCARELAAAATVLGERDIAKRALRLLRSVPDKLFFLGAITNYELPKKVPASLRTIERGEALQAKYPPYSEEKLLETLHRLARTEKYIAMCLDGSMKAEMLAGASEMTISDICSILVALGRFDESRDIDRACGPVDTIHVGMVRAIELYRRGRHDEALLELNELESLPINGWTRITLALGFAGKSVLNYYIE